MEHIKITCLLKYYLLVMASEEITYFSLSSPKISLQTLHKNIVNTGNGSITLFVFYSSCPFFVVHTFNTAFYR